MTPEELLDTFRFEMADSVVPYLWGDDEVFSYLNDAQTKFCQWGVGIPDSSTASVCYLDLTTDEEFSDLSPAVLQIRKAYLVSTGVEIDIVNIESASYSASADDYYKYISGYKLDDTTGAVRAAIIGMEKNKVRWYRIPAEDDQVRLVVWRLPLEKITDTSTEFEIDDQYVEGLLDWVKKRAYGSQDVDKKDAQKALECEAKFRAYCEQCRLEQQRRDHVVRVVAYGGC